MNKKTSKIVLELDDHEFRFVLNAVVRRKQDLALALKFDKAMSTDERALTADHAQMFRDLATKLKKIAEPK